MNKRLAANRNLHLHYEPTYKGFACNQSRGPLIVECLEANLSVMNRALNDHPRTLVVRIDLLFPRFYQCDADNSVIARFIGKLRYCIDVDCRQRRANGARVHDTRLRSIWCREETDESNGHYHMLLFVNRDTYFQLGNFKSFDKGLAGMINTAWASALKLDHWNAIGTVNFPENPLYHLQEGSPDFAQVFQEAFYRASYLAKAKTKTYGNRYRSFGVSQI